MLDDLDPEQTQEWIDSVDAVVAVEGPDRARRLLERVIARAR